jgi:DNA (cytosine-5)-methyltransferase 1
LSRLFLKYIIHAVHIPKAAEVFSGAGLFGAAFKEMGFATVYAAEINPRAVKSFNLNVAPVAEVRDAQAVRSDIRCDILLAGPPCQGFSTQSACNPSAHAATARKRNKLSLVVSEWASATKAKVVVVENVPKFFESWHWTRLRRAMDVLGYECAAWVLRAESYGAPQLRTRAFGIFSKLGLPEAPKPSVRRPMTVREAFEGLPVQPDESGMHFAPPPSPIALSRFRHIPPCGDKRDVIRRAPELCPPSWQRMGVEATDVWGRLDYDRPANTLRCDFQNASKGRYVHPIADRVITLREGARIQGVPDIWRFEGVRGHVAEQIGNGVPLPLGRAVAGALRPLFS